MSWLEFFVLIMSKYKLFLHAYFMFNVLVVVRLSTSSQLHPLLKFLLPVKCCSCAYSLYLKISCWTSTALVLIRLLNMLCTSASAVLEISDFFLSKWWCAVNFTGAV